MVVGIRPEDVFVGGDVKSHIIDATVDAVENMGSEKYVYLKAGADNVAAKVGRETPSELGMAMNISFNEKKIHCFDKESKQRIGL